MPVSLMRHNFIAVLLWIMVWLPVNYGWSQAVVDSLDQQLAVVEGDAKMVIYHQLVDHLSETNPRRAISLGQEALTSTGAAVHNAGLYFGIGKAYLALESLDSAQVFLDALEAIETQVEQAATWHEFLEAKLARISGDRDTSLSLLLPLLEEFRSKDDLDGEAHVLHEIGNIYHHVGQLHNALDVYADARETYLAAENPIGASKVLLDAGLTYDIMGEFEEALTFYSRALEVQDAEDDFVGAGIALCNIGIFYDLIGEWERAIEYHDRSRALCEETGQAICAANALTNIGAIRLEQGQARQAITLFNQAETIFGAYNKQYELAQTLNELGQAYHQVRDIDRALSSFADARALYESLGQKEGLASVLIDAGRLYRRQAHYDEAFDALTDGIMNAAEMNAELLLKEGYHQLFLLHEGFGEYREALDAHKLFKEASDSLISHESQAILAELQTQFRTQEQRLRIQGLETERANQQRLMIVLLSGLFLLFGLAIFAYRLYRQKSVAHVNLQTVYEDLQSAQQKLIHSEKMASLGQLTAGVAHEIRNPLNFIINFSKLNVELSEELVEEINDEKDQKVGDVAEKFEAIIKDLSFNAKKVNEHSHRADGIVQSMLEHANATRQERVPTDINEFVQEIVDLAFYGVNQTEHACDINVKTKFARHIGSYDLAPQELGRVLVNLLDNAIYAVCEKKEAFNGVYHPEISLETVSVNGNVIIRLQDNGPGMSEEKTRKIFEPFYTTKPTGKGTGLGLSLAYDIVTMGYGGEMSVSSKEGEGTTFEISLPKA